MHVLIPVTRHPTARATSRTAHEPRIIDVNSLGPTPRPPFAVRGEFRTVPVTPQRKGRPAPSLVDEVVVPVEGTDREFFAQQSAVQIAASLGVVLRAIHIGSPGSRQRGDLFDYLRTESWRWGVPFESEIMEGEDVAGEIVEEVGPRDLIVIGSRRLGHRFHIGSVTEALVRRAPCPVQIVRIE